MTWSSRIADSIHAGIMKTSQLALEILFPTKCAVCAKPPSLLCEACKPFPSIEVEKGDPPLWSALRYSEPFSKIINAYKESNRTAIAGYLVFLLDGLLREIQLHHDFQRIVFADSSRKNYQKRGFNPVFLLLRKSSVAGKFPITKLDLARQTLDQAALSREDREKNLRNAFISPKNIQGCLILDDVTTTGATLAAMTEAVTLAGGSVTARAVLAKSFWN